MGHEFIRFIPEIGLWSFSRGRHTCRWQSAWCRRFCYAKKLYALKWANDECDRQDDEWWMTRNAEAIAKEILRVASDDNGPPDRFRFAVKGETWTATCDVVKVGKIASLLPSTHFWIPTRAWHDHAMRNYIERIAAHHPNIHALASVDPDTTLGELAQLRADGWSLVFAGDNGCGQMLLDGDSARENPTDGMHRCEKTWEQRSGHCEVCVDGCFSPGRMEIHLKQHK